MIHRADADTLPADSIPLIRAGVVTIPDYEPTVTGPLYHEMEAFSDKWRAAHRRTLVPYARQWVSDPLRQGTRRWEYPFVFSRLDPICQNADTFRVLDAGSGVTFFPYFMASKWPGSQITCCDANASFRPLFDAINGGTSAKVQFDAADLRKLPYETGTFDAVTCVSVLEHTTAYRDIVEEFARVLSPEGVAIITFDICLDGQSEISPDGAADLLEAISAVFPKGDAVDLQPLSRPEALATTDYFRRTNPSRLPWRRPDLKTIVSHLRWRRWPRRRFVSLAFCGLMRHR